MTDIYLAKLGILKKPYIKFHNYLIVFDTTDFKIV